MNQNGSIVGLFTYCSTWFQQNGPIESEEVVEDTDTDTEAESSRKLASGCKNCTVEETEAAGEEQEEVEEATEVPFKERKVRSLLTRSNIYRIFIDKLKRLVKCCLKFIRHY